MKRNGLMGFSWNKSKKNVRKQYKEHVEDI